MKRKMKELITFLVFASHTKESTNQLILSAFFNESINRVMRRRLVVACIFQGQDKCQKTTRIPNN